MRLAGREIHSFIRELWFYIIGLLCNRVETLVKHEAPPLCYCQLLSDNEDQKFAAFQLMMSDWKLLCTIEQASSAVCQELTADLRGPVSSPVRLIYLLMEAGDQAQALEILNALCKGFPDTKVIEDVHQAIRCDSSQNPNQKHTASKVQNIIMNSQVREKREIPHPAGLTKQAFMSKWKKNAGSLKRGKGGPPLN